MTKVQRYKVGFFQDEWGMSSNTPCLVPDYSGYAVKFEDYCKLEAENERLERNLSTTEQIEHETAEACAKVYLNTYNLTDIADDIRSGKWREYL